MLQEQQSLQLKLSVESKHIVEVNKYSWSDPSPDQSTENMVVNAAVLLQMQSLRPAANAHDEPCNCSVKQGTAFTTAGIVQNQTQCVHINAMNM